MTDHTYRYQSSSDFELCNPHPVFENMCRYKSAYRAEPYSKQPRAELILETLKRLLEVFFSFSFAKVKEIVA